VARIGVGRAGDATFAWGNHEISTPRLVRATD
jgi:hypothetical protein